MLRALSDYDQALISNALSVYRWTCEEDAAAHHRSGSDTIAQAFLNTIPGIDNLQALIADRLVFVGEEGDA